MVQADSDRVPRAPSYSGSHSFQFRFRLQVLHLVPLSFQSHSSISAFFFCGPTTPARCRFRLLQFRSPLLPESLLFSSPPGTKMFQFPGFSSLKLCIGLRIAPHYWYWVAPFGYPRIVACVRLPEAFRRYLRPSSALYAKTSTVRSASFNHFLLENC